MTKTEEKIFNYAKSVDFNVELIADYINNGDNIDYLEYAKLEGSKSVSKAENFNKKYNNDFYKNFEGDKRESKG